MRTPVLLLLALTLFQACRTSRDTIEIQDRRGPPRPPADDYLNVGRSVETTFAISAISLPVQGRAYEFLNLGLRRPGELTEVYSSHPYQPGETLTIEPHLDYEVVVTAMRGSIEVYSTTFCQQRSSFRALEGRNVFTASLCAKPGTP